MSIVTVERDIAAPEAVVFAAIADFERLPETNPDVLRIEFLSETKTGSGTRFRETRRMGRKTQDFELHITECAPGRLRTVCDTDGITWDTTMTVTPTAGGSTLRMVMDARGHSRGKRVFAWVFAPFFRRGISSHITRLQAYCERKAMAQSRS